MLHRILNRLMDENRLTRLDSENYSDNELDLYTRANESNGMPLKVTLTRSDIFKQMHEESLSPIVMNKLIIDFFVKLGMKDEAATFAQEIGESISFKSELRIHQACNELVELFDSGRIDEATQLIEKMVPGIFNRRKDLLFQIRSLKLFRSESIVNCSTLSTFLTTELIPLITTSKTTEERQLLNTQLECIAGSFLFKKKAPYSADELIQNISREMFIAAGVSQKTKIEELISLLMTMQETLGMVCEFSPFNEDGLFKITDEF
jgi:hypothetical protein